METVEIPGGDGVLDLTEFFDEIKYKNRTLSFEFTTQVPTEQFMEQFSKVQNALHGQKMNIILTEDPDWYYIGRISVSEWKADRNIGKLTIDCDCDPYKHRMSSQAVYLYGKNILDLANLEQGVINAIGGKSWTELTVSTSKTRLRSKYPFPIKPDTQYTISFPSGTFRLATRQFDKNNLLISSGGWYTGTATFRTMKEAVTLAVYIAFSNDATILPSDVTSLAFQIEEGSVATAFEAFDKTAKSISATFSNRRKATIPTVYVPTEMTVENGHNLATLYPGENSLPDFVFAMGENTLTFKGNSAAIVKWKEGAL